MKSNKAGETVKTTSLPRVTKLKKGDRVKQITGKIKTNAATIGTVKEIDTKNGRVLVEGLNLVKRHSKGNPVKNTPAGIITKEAAIHVSNVLLVCPKCLKPTRIGYKILEARKENGKINKVRICRRCHEQIDD
ncbi:MAG: 50S ribosomal protein L24 [Deltaproteobacteria bacterium]|jgi:large subunit ribosomal protein L24|nr:50S ribosomal protein L24 [Deltaproteobacteria bacterium]